MSSRGGGSVLTAVSPRGWLIIHLILLTILMLRLEKLIGLIPFYITFISLVVYTLVYMRSVLNKILNVDINTLIISSTRSHFNIKIYVNMNTLIRTW